MARRLVLAGMAVTTLAAAALLGAAPAYATNSGENCNTNAGPYDPGGSGAGNFCYFYTSNNAGAEMGIEGNDPNLSANEPIYFDYRNFDGTIDGVGAGRGLNDAVWNDAGSGINLITNCAVTVYSGTGYSGPYSYRLTALTGSGSLGNVTNLNQSQEVCTG